MRRLTFTRILLLLGIILASFLIFLLFKRPSGRTYVSYKQSYLIAKKYFTAFNDTSKVKNLEDINKLVDKNHLDIILITGTNLNNYKCYVFEKYFNTQDTVKEVEFYFDRWALYEIRLHEIEKVK